MKITICSSLSFAKEIVDAKEQLEKLGHYVFYPASVYSWIKNPKKELNMDLEYCIENNVMKNHFDKIVGSDAILVLNYDKKGVKGYVGGSTLMEMAVAHYLNKKIFLINPTPDLKDLRYSMEIQLTKPIIINGDLSKIN